MALTITGFPDCRAVLGPSQSLRAYILKPAASDYAPGGYTINASQVDMADLFGAWLIGGNSASAAYQPKFIFPTSTFAASPGPFPATSIQMIVGQNSGSGVPLTLGTTVTSTNSALTSNVATVTAPNTFSAGQFVVLQGFSNAAATSFNGLVVQIVTASLTQFTFNFTHANITSGADTGTAALVTSPSGAITSATAVASTNSALTSNVATITVANTFSPGNLVVLQGFSNALATAFNGVIVQVVTASSSQFTFNFNHANISSGADTGTAALVVSPGGGAIATGTAATVTNTALTSNVGTVTAANTFVPGELVILQGLTNGATLNGRVQSVIATGLSPSQFEFNFTTGNISTGADAGTAAPLVTGPLGEFVQVPAGTDLSSMSWIVDFLGY